MKFDVGDLRPKGATPLDVCPGVSGLQRAIVAFGRGWADAVVVSSSCGIRLDQHDAGIKPIDTIGTPPDDFSGASIMVWEGRIEVRSDEGDVDYVGTWRRPCPVEWQALMTGGAPFECRECDGFGWKATSSEGCHE